jgi:hypothetical protein
MLRERRGAIHGRLRDGEGVPVLEADERLLAAS